MPKRGHGFPVQPLKRHKLPNLKGSRRASTWTCACPTVNPASQTFCPVCYRCPLWVCARCTVRNDSGVICHVCFAPKPEQDVEAEEVPTLPEAPKLGELWDISRHVASLHGANTVVGKTSYLSNVDEDGNLTLALHSCSNNRDEAHKCAVDAAVNELAQRQTDLEAIEAHVKHCMAKLMSGSDDAQEVSVSMVEVLAGKGTHVKRIAELKSQQSVSVTYHKTERRQAVSLAPGVWTKLSWFSKPLMWLPAVQTKYVVETVDVTEDVPLTLPSYIYALGGIYVEEGRKALRTVERFDPLKGAWDDVAPMSTARVAHGVAMVCGEPYAVGGWNVSRMTEAVSSVERFDPTQNKWCAVESMSTKRACHGVAALDGCLYVVGGLENDDAYHCPVMSSVERFDPIQNKWFAVASLSTARCRLGLAVLDRQLYAVGGMGDHGPLSSVERFDPTLNKWCDVAPMGKARCNHGVAVAGGQLYAVGADSIERFDPKSNSWAVVAAMPTRRNNFGVAALDGKLFVLGGSTSLSPGGDKACVERFDPTLNEWSVVPAMSSKRSCHAVVGYSP